LREYLYISDSSDFKIPKIHFSYADIDSFDEKQSYAVANIDRPNVINYAPEIDIFIKKSLESDDVKIESIKKLYEARAIKFDYAEYKDYEKELLNRVVIFSNDLESKLLKEFKDSLGGFEVLELNSESIEYISGEMGSFELKLLDIDKTISFDQAIFLEDSKEYNKFFGIYEYNDNFDEIAERVKSRVGLYRFKKIISYDSSICQYHHRRDEICSICAEVCPTYGVDKDNSIRELIFSDIECLGCGGCISVCPSGAIEFAQLPFFAFEKIAKLYREKTILLIPQNLLETIDFNLPKNILPLVIEGAKFISESHIITLAQESGNSIVFYTDILSKGAKDGAKIVNSVYEKIYNKKAFHIAFSKEEVLEALDSIDTFPTYDKKLEAKTKREAFSQRLKYIVGKSDFGTIDSGEIITYGRISIDKQKCTLCMSCVGACNMDALLSKFDEFGIDFTPSLCTNCTYCISSCPEKCMELKSDKIELNPAWFEYEELAKDDIFKCIECSKPFTNKRAIEKIITLMTPIFAGDDLKLKTLKCCPDCKAKVVTKEFAKGVVNSGK